MYGTKDQYHSLRQAIKNGNITWQSIIEQPRIQSWTLVSEQPHNKANPLSLREPIAVGKPFVNGDAFLLATDKNGKVYADRGSIKGQSARMRKVGVIAKKGLLINDKRIQRPVYEKPQSNDIFRHQLEVIFAANSVYVNDVASGSEDKVNVRAPKHYKAIVRKRGRKIIT